MIEISISFESKLDCTVHSSQSRLKTWSHQNPPPPYMICYNVIRGRERVRERGREIHREREREREQLALPAAGARLHGWGQGRPSPRPGLAGQPAATCQPGPSVCSRSPAFLPGTTSVKRSPALAKVCRGISGVDLDIISCESTRKETQTRIISCKLQACMVLYYLCRLFRHQL